MCKGGFHKRSKFINTRSTSCLSMWGVGFNFQVPVFFECSVVQVSVTERLVGSVLRMSKYKGYGSLA